jgi:phage terminase large subunit GpA-like protein
MQYEILKSFKPPADIRLSEWADKYYYLSPESSHESGRWRCIPYQREILDTMGDIEHDEISIIKSARVGYTKMLNILSAYHVKDDPCPMLIVQPTIEDAQGYSKDELATMLRDVPALDGLVSDPKTRDSTNTILKKYFNGGSITIVGANSPRGFRRISARVVMFDEIDGYPISAGSEGDQIRLGTMRSAFFWNRKIIKGSTPTIKKLSKIEASFETSDMRFYYVPCPLCKHFQVLKWGSKGENFGFKFSDRNPDTVWYQCEKCSGRIDHNKKFGMVESGEWRKHQPEVKRHAGFHIWAAYSYAPNATWQDIVDRYLKAFKIKESLQVWTNTDLGESFEQIGDQPDWNDIKKRSEKYPMMTVPGGSLITAGVDTQDDRLAIIIRSWGENEESWLIYHGEIIGDPNDDYIWNELDKFLMKNFITENGTSLKIAAMAIDSGGHRTQAVYNYCRKRKSLGVMAIIGSNQRSKPVLSRPSLKDVSWHGKTIEQGVELWAIGTDTAKSTIYSRIRSSSGHGVYHFPDILPEEYYLQLTSEKEIVEMDPNGYPKSKWVKTRDRNESLDCEVYAYAAAIRAGLLYMNMSGNPEKKIIPQATVQKKHTQQRISGYNRPSWMNR